MLSETKKGGNKVTCIILESEKNQVNILISFVCMRYRNELETSLEKKNQ